MFDIQENVKIGGKVIEIYEGVIYCKNFEVSPFEKVIGKNFELQQKYKYENNDVMQLLVILILLVYMVSKFAKMLKKVLVVNQKLGWWLNRMNEL